MELTEAQQRLPEQLKAVVGAENVTSNVKVRGSRLGKGTAMLLGLEYLKVEPYYTILYAILHAILYILKYYTMPYTILIHAIYHTPYAIHRPRVHQLSRLVLQPSTLRQAVRCLELCSLAQVAVLPQGANTSLTGGSVPRDCDRPFAAGRTGSEGFEMDLDGV